ncbi:hypothetical protein QQF64_022718 [Cirrhinus molitorella]|uniref:Chemokine interleukin-8-like domain-containing protein n=1 Tax=Cirrhinus molitorella TaxID=172907 RepID=A0ABR3L3F9_9TELE
MCCKLVTPVFYLVTISACKKHRQPSIVNSILRVGFEEEEGDCSTLRYQTTDLSSYLASRPKAFKNVMQTRIVSDICKNSLSKLQISFRSESMRTTSLCLVLGMVLLMAWTSEATTEALAVPKQCCFNFIDFPIPLQRIASAQKTSSGCPVAGIVVTTLKGLEFCVKPDEEWIKKKLEN